MSGKQKSPELHCYSLDNGITVIVREYRAIPIVSVACYFLGGVSFESETTNGISYLMQKLILKGTKRRSASNFAFETEAIGSVVVPFTSKDAFGCHMTLLAKDLDKGLDLLTDALFKPAIYEEEVGKERHNIYSEIKELRDDIISYTLELCDKAVFKGHPYSFSIRGDEKTLAALTRSNLQEWHKVCYRPDNMVVSIVGDVDLKKLPSFIERYFASLKSQKRASYPSIPLADNIHPKEIVEEGVKRQLSLAIGFPAPSVESGDFVIFDLLNSILSGMGSRLFIELRDKKGLAYVVSSRYEATSKTGAFKAYIATSPKQEQVSRNGLMEELEKIRTIFVSDAELERAKRYMLGLYEISLQKTVSQAMKYARLERIGLGASLVHKYSKLVEKVTKQDIKRVAKQYLRPDLAGVAIVRPISS